MVTTTDLIKEKSHRIRYTESIHINPHISKIPTINGFYAVNAGTSYLSEKHKVKYVLPSEVLFRFYQYNIKSQTSELMVGTFSEVIINTIIHNIFPQLIEIPFISQLYLYYNFTDNQLQKFL